MRKKILITLLTLATLCITACGNNDEVKVEIPEKEMQGNSNLEDILQKEPGKIEVETETNEEETNKETENKIEENTVSPEKLENAKKDDTLYVISKGNYFGFNGQSTFSLHPVGAKTIKKTETSNGVTVTYSMIEGTILVTGNSDMLKPLYDNADYIYIKISYTETNVNGQEAYEIVDYECFDKETKESLGKLSVEELENLKNEANDKEKEERDELLKDMEELTDSSIDITKLELNKYYFVKNNYTPFVSTNDSYAVYTFDIDEEIDLNDFSIFNKGTMAAYNGNEILMVQIIDKNFIKEHEDEFDIINVSDIIDAGVYNSFSKDIIYNDTDKTVDIKCEDSNNIYTIEPGDYKSFSWVHDGDLMIE